MVSIGRQQFSIILALLVGFMIGALYSGYYFHFSIDLTKAGTQVINKQLSKAEMPVTTMHHIENVGHVDTSLQSSSTYPNRSRKRQEVGQIVVRQIKQSNKGNSKNILQKTEKGNYKIPIFKQQIEKSKKINPTYKKEVLNGNKYKKTHLEQPEKYKKTRVAHGRKTEKRNHTNKNLPRAVEFIKKEYLGQVVSRNDSGWYLESHFCKNKTRFVLSHLRGPQQTPIFVYSPNQDQWISGNIIRSGTWEFPLVNRIHNILLSDPGLVFVDIGANVGVFSLTAAKLGRFVIAIDPLYKNVERLCMSMKKGGLSSKMTIIHNALSNRREQVLLGTYSKNVGGTFVKEVGRKFQETNELVANAILLDDLLEIVKFKRAVIKMDAEKFEANILKGADNFFKTVEVKFLLLEFKSHKGKSSGDFIVNFLKRHNIFPETKITDHSKWPSEVMFKRI